MMSSFLNQPTSKLNNSKKCNNNEIKIYFYQNNRNILFFYYKSNHPKILQTEQYNLGQFILFRNDKIYAAELKSEPHLNVGLNWSPKLFQTMLDQLNNFRVQQDCIDFNSVISLRLDILTKGKQVMMFRLDLKQQFSNKSPINQLWHQFNQYSQFKSRQIQSVNLQFQNSQLKLQQELNTLEITQVQQENKVYEIKGKLSALLFQKQLKLSKVSFGNCVFNYEINNDDDNGEYQFQEERIKNNKLAGQQSMMKGKGNQPLLSNWISSQDERMLVGSLFAPSQQFRI